MFAQKSSSTEPEVTLTQCHMNCEMQSHVTPARAITGISGTKLHKAQDRSRLQHFTAESLDLEEKPLKEEKQRGEIPMSEVQLQSKRIPPSWFFSAGHCKEKSV